MKLILSRACLTSAVLLAAVLVTGFWVNSAFAHPDHSRSYKHSDFHSYHPHSRDYHHRKRYQDHWTSKHRAYQNQVVRLDLPVRIRGSERVHLRRLINQHYNIDLKNYRLRNVVFHNRSRRDGYAQLNVGRYSSRPVALYRGYHRISAPNSNGRWTLDVENLRTKNIQVVLEPTRPRHRRGHRYTAYYR